MKLSTYNRNVIPKRKIAEFGDFSIKIHEGFNGPHNIKERTLLNIEVYQHRDFVYVIGQIRFFDGKKFIDHKLRLSISDLESIFEIDMIDLLYGIVDSNVLYDQFKYDYPEWFRSQAHLLMQ